MSDDVVGLTRSTANDLVEHLYGGQPEDAPRNREQRGDDDRFRARNVFVNRSGETVPPFALMRTTGLQNDRYVVEIAKPDGSGSPCLVNGPREVADGALGSYQDASNHFVLLTDATSGSLGPGNDWPAVPGSVFRILGQIEPGQALVQLEKAGCSFAQAPAGGLPARQGGVLGQAECDVLISAPSAGANYAEGELVKTGRTIMIQNYGSSVVADEGDRLIQHDGTKIVGYDCANSGNPNDFQTLEGA